MALALCLEVLVLSAECSVFVGQGDLGQLRFTRGGYLRTSADMISEKEDRKHASIASHSVDSAGKHIASCRNAMRLAMVTCGV